MTEPLLGRSVNRLEDERFVRGRGRYIADLVASNALHGAALVTSRGWHFAGIAEKERQCVVNT